MTVALYHNPRCSKSRQALALLRERGIAPRIIEYLKTPPDADELRGLLDALGMRPSELLRRREPVCREAKLNTGDVTEEQIFTALCRHPILIERPIIVANGRAVIGRPAENILSIL